MLRTDTVEVKKQLVWVISNAANSATESEKRYLVDQGVLTSLLHLIQPDKHIENEISRVAAEGLQAMFSMSGSSGDPKVRHPFFEEFMEADGQRILFEAKQHINDDVCETAIALYDQLWPDGEEPTDKDEHDPKEHIEDHDPKA